MRAIHVAIALGAILPAAAQATDEILVTGTRLEVAPDGLPAPVTVLDRDDIEAAGEATLPDLLRRVPGLLISQPGAGGVSQLILRGAEPNFTVVMIDGIRVNDPNNTRGGSFDLASLNLAEVERIEVVRGAQSSIYGSDALAGVVNVISRTPAATAAAFAAGEAGGHGYARVSAGASGQAGGGLGAIEATRRDDGEAVEGSRYEASTVAGRWRWRSGERWDGGVQARFADTEASSYPEQSGGPRQAEYHEVDERRAHDLSAAADLTVHWRNDLRLTGQYSRYERRDRYDSPGIAPGNFVPPNGADSDLERDNLGVRLAWSPDPDWQATVGLSAERETGRSSGYLQLAPDVRVPTDYELERDTLGLFVEGRWQARDNLQLQASARRDDPDTASAETTGQFGTVLRLAEGATELSANVGRGFKLPSFFALGNPLVGEPGLRPEKSRSLDVGMRQRFAAGHAALTLFDNEYEDLIDFDPDTFRNVNRDRVTTRGAELQAGWSLGEGLEGRLHANHVNIDVKGSDRELLQRPEWSGGAGLRWETGGDWRLDLDWLWVGRVRDTRLAAAGPQTETLGDYHRVDAALSWRSSARLQWTLAVDNLLDASYREAIGFPAAGIRPRLSVTWRTGG